jgi:hypothetical protein
MQSIIFSILFLLNLFFPIHREIRGLNDWNIIILDGGGGSIRMRVAFKSVRYDQSSGHEGEPIGIVFSYHSETGETADLNGQWIWYGGLDFEKL